MSSTMDKAKGKVNQAVGKAKEKVGHDYNDSSLKNEGKAQQVKGHVQEATGKIKEAVKDKH